MISASTTGAILTLNCTDADNGVDGSLVYSISTSTHSNKFTISNLGVVSVPAPIPPDSNTEVYDITVVVADQGSPSRQTDVAVNFVYSFENLQQPQFDATQYSTSIPESTAVGDVVLTVSLSTGRPLISYNDRYIVDLCVRIRRNRGWHRNHSEVRYSEFVAVRASGDAVH